MYILYLLGGKIVEYYFTLVPLTFDEDIRFILWRLI